MGSRYLFICLYVWLEKYFSAGDYKRKERRSAATPHGNGT
jgi:dolichol-phosphate mannosyltransferase